MGLSLIAFKLEVKGLQSHFRKIDVVTTHTMDQLARLKVSQGEDNKVKRGSLGNGLNNPGIKVPGTTTRQQQRK